MYLHEWTKFLLLASSHTTLQGEPQCSWHRRQTGDGPTKPHAISVSGVPPHSTSTAATLMTNFTHFYNELPLLYSPTVVRAEELDVAIVESLQSTSESSTVQEKRRTAINVGCWTWLLKLIAVHAPSATVEFDRHRKNTVTRHTIRASEDGGIWEVAKSDAVNDFALMMQVINHIVLITWRSPAPLMRPRGNGWTTADRTPDSGPKRRWASR